MFILIILGLIEYRGEIITSSKNIKNITKKYNIIIMKIKVLTFNVDSSHIIDQVKTKKYFSKFYLSKDGLKSQCKICDKKGGTIYNNTERGFIVNLYGSMKKKIRAKRYSHLTEKEKEKYRCHITQEEFFELWEDHKKRFGYHCRLTGVKIVCQRAQNGKGLRYLGYSNAVSVDRLDPNIGYTKDNIIFISNEANKIKNAVTKDLCIKILKLYEEKGL